MREVVGEEGHGESTLGKMRARTVVCVGGVVQSACDSSRLSVAWSRGPVTQSWGRQRLAGSEVESAEGFQQRRTSSKHLH